MSSDAKALCQDIEGPPFKKPRILSPLNLSKTPQTCTAVTSTNAILTSTTTHHSLCSNLSTQSSSSTVPNSSSFVGGINLTIANGRVVNNSNIEASATSTVPHKISNTAVSPISHATTQLKFVSSMIRMANNVAINIPLQQGVVVNNQQSILVPLASTGAFNQPLQTIRLGAPVPIPKLAHASNSSGEKTVSLQNKLSLGKSIIRPLQVMPHSGSKSLTKRKNVKIASKKPPVLIAPMKSMTVKSAQSDKSPNSKCDPLKILQNVCNVEFPKMDDTSGEESPAKPSENAAGADNNDTNNNHSHIAKSWDGSSDVSSGDNRKERSLSPPILEKTPKIDNRSAGDEDNINELRCDEDLDSSNEEATEVKAQTTDGSCFNSILDQSDLSLADSSDPMALMTWKNGIGTLPESDLKFRRNEFGLYEVISDSVDVEQSSQVTESQTANDDKVCLGRLTSHNDDTVIKDESVLNEGSQSQISNPAIVNDKRVSTTSFSPIQQQKLSRKKTVRDLLNKKKKILDWEGYLKSTNSVGASEKLFKCAFSPFSCSLKGGMKLEGIGPKKPGVYSVLTVAETRGFRVRLHYDEDSESNDFWANADCPFLFPVGWCEKNGKKLEPPRGYCESGNFTWGYYLRDYPAIIVQKTHLNQLDSFDVPRTHFLIGSKLEAVDRKNTNKVCVATIVDTLGEYILLHFDGSDDTYDFWCNIDSPYIHHVGWCHENDISLSTPPDYLNDSFTWPEYLKSTGATAVPKDAFYPRQPVGFESGMKLEVVDKRNPILIRVATIMDVQDYRIKIHFDGWLSAYDYWVDDDSSDIHPPGWCERTGHPLMFPLTPADLVVDSGEPGCPTSGCKGMGHIKGAKYSGHHSALWCPYSKLNLNQANENLSWGNMGLDHLPVLSTSPSRALENCDVLDRETSKSNKVKDEVATSDQDHEANPHAFPLPDEVHNSRPVVVRAKRGRKPKFPQDKAMMVKDLLRKKRKKVFDWDKYLRETKGIGASHKLFRQAFPFHKNLLRPLMKLEGIGPKKQGVYSVLTVADSRGFRVRLHYDNDIDSNDFWANADSPFLFPVGWCAKHGKTLEPPQGYYDEDDFNWDTYLVEHPATVVQKGHLHLNSTEVISTPFHIGSKLEAIDRENTDYICVATVIDSLREYILVHFDGWDSMYDYWCNINSPYIHPVGWCQENNKVITSPPDWQGEFSWEKYLKSTQSTAVPIRAFRPRRPVGFEAGMKLEVVDKRNPILVRVATICEVHGHQIKVHFDGWDSAYDYWLDDDSANIHPPRWCERTGHPLMPPLTSLDFMVGSDESGCLTPGCNGIGHIKGARYSGHNSLFGCPYSKMNMHKDNENWTWDYIGLTHSLSTPIISQTAKLDLPTPKDLSVEPDEERCEGSRSHDETALNESMSPTNDQVDPQNSLPPSTSPNYNQLTVIRKRGRKPKSFLHWREKKEKEEREQEDIRKMHLGIHQSIFMSSFYVQTEPKSTDLPFGWDQHTKLLPGVRRYTGDDVNKWNVEQVAEFIRILLGSADISQAFREQQIDGEAFLLLTQADLVKLMNLKLGPAVKVYNSVVMFKTSITV